MNSEKEFDNEFTRNEWMWITLTILFLGGLLGVAAYFVLK